MKRKIFLRISFLLATALLVVTCTKSDIEKSRDAYDATKVVPVVQFITGTLTPMQGRHYEYAASTREGSSFSWSTAMGAEIVPITTMPAADVKIDYRTYVYFPNVITSANPAEVISVTETTVGGNTSVPKTTRITTVSPFAALPISGSNLVNGGFSSVYSVNPSNTDKIFSTFTWTSTKGVITPTPDSPWKATIAFSNNDVGNVVISMTERTTKGKTATSTFNVQVMAYCALNNGIANLVGTWSGTDGYAPDIYASQVVTSAPSGKTIMVTGLNYGWIADYWAETVTSGGTVSMIVNLDGTVVIQDQFCFTTDYNGVSSEYWIFGSGRWNNCGPKPTMTITYNIYYKSDGYNLPSNSNKTLKFTATLTLGAKGAEFLKAVMTQSEIDKVTAFKRSIR